jgi:hypothetical protein
MCKVRKLYNITPHQEKLSPRAQTPVRTYRIGIHLFVSTLNVFYDFNETIYKLYAICQGRGGELNHPNLANPHTALVEKAPIGPVITG